MSSYLQRVWKMLNMDHRLSHKQMPDKGPLSGLASSASILVAICLLCHTQRLPLLQEFFQLLMRDMFDTDYGMFKLDEETRMYWFRASKIDMTMEFELVGTMIGLAIYNSHLLEFSFPMLTYR